MAFDTPSQLTPDAVQERVQSWLSGEGWRLEQKQHDGAVWLVEAQDSAGRHLVVGQRDGRSDQILLEGTVAVADQHQRLFTALPAAQRQELLWELRFCLLNLEVEFHGVQEPLSRIMVGQRIYYDGLSKDNFLQRVSKVRNGVLAVIWTVARRLQPAFAVVEPSDTGVH